MPHVMGCDTDGTVTDVIVVHEEGRSFVGKAATTSHDDVSAAWRRFTRRVEARPTLFLSARCYRQWLGRPLPDEVELTVKTLARIR